jgi:hypothetical protein
MKTTIDIPDALAREAKVLAAREGVTLRAIVTRALQGELSRRAERPGRRPPWLRSFGALKSLRPESRRITKAIEEQFERTDEEMWR